MTSHFNLVHAICKPFVLPANKSNAPPHITSKERNWLSLPRPSNSMVYSFKKKSFCLARQINRENNLKPLSKFGSFTLKQNNFKRHQQVNMLTYSLIESLIETTFVVHIKVTKWPSLLNCDRIL